MLKDKTGTWKFSKKNKTKSVKVIDIDVLKELTIFLIIKQHSYDVVEIIYL